MFRTTLFVFLFLFFLSACKNAIKDEEVSDKETPENIEIKEPVHSLVTNNTIVRSEEDLIGYWVGWFAPDTKRGFDDYILTGDHLAWDKKNKITISIDTIRNDSVIGHSVVAGNLRPFRGSFKLEKDTFNFIGNEPGDDKYDGIFKFSISLNDKYLIGNWASYKKIETPKRIFKLEKKHFEYNANGEIRYDFTDWLKTKRGKGYNHGDELEDIEIYFRTTGKVTELNPSIDLLSEDVVSQLTKADIYVLRNSIYAKHGYSFKKRALRVFFDRHDWYMPVHTNIKAELTNIEKQNIKLLLRYEKYAEEYYDEFGRG